MPEARRGILGPQAVVAGFFVGLVLLGLATYRDFGVSWDETDHYEYGQLVKDRYTEGDRSSDTFLNLSTYGPVGAVAQAVVADAIDPAPVDEIPLAHLVNYLIFLTGAFALYCLVRRQTGSRGWGALGAGLLVLSPRAFSHAFVNPRDTAFLAVMTVCMALLVRYLETRRWWDLVLLGIATGILIDLRIVGLMMVGLAVAAIVVEETISRSSALATTVPLSVFLGTLLPVVLLGWPYLWDDPIDRLRVAFSYMREFTDGPQEMLYRGVLTSVQSPPWHYLPVWIGISTPLPYLGLAGVGLGVTLRRNPVQLYRDRLIERHQYLHLAWLAGPLILVTVADSALYDEWCHLIFVYPALLIFTVLGARRVWSWVSSGPRMIANGVAVIGLLALAWIGLTMWRLHPYEAVYFNELAGGTAGARGDFEMDYWGLSYKDGLAYLLDRHPDETLRVYVCTRPGELNARLFRDRARLDFVDEVEDADFALCAPRGEELLAGDGRTYLPEAPTIATVRRDGAVLLHVKDLGGADPDA